MTKVNTDKQWAWFNEDIQKFLKDDDFYSLGNTYYKMSEFLKNEGKDDSKLRDLGYKTKLQFQKERLKELVVNSNIITGIEIIACTNCTNVNNDSCEVCKKLDGKIFSIKEALSTNPLPVKNCSHLSGCRCVYGPVID